jgi:predicted dinucleotide-utilizing enzyme
LGVEGPKGGEIKEKVEGTRLRQASKWSMITVFSMLRLSSHVKEVRS